jgi:capsular polysaccharide biosynthesis protein
MTLSRDRRLWILSAAVLIGVVVGIVVSYAGSASLRAEAAVLVSSNKGQAAVEPFLPNLRTLATSSLLAGNVKSTLRLTEPSEQLRSRLSAGIRPHTQVIVISATGKSARSAQQLAQEAAVVFSLLVGERFRTTTPSLKAMVLDPAHVVGGPNRHVARNVLIGGVLGLVLGAIVAILFVGPAPAPAQGPPQDARELMRREKLLESRIDTVTAREREIATRAGTLKEQERELAKRERQFEEQARALEPPPPEPEPPPPEPEPPPPEPEPPPPEPPTPAVAARGGWNIHDLEQLVAAKADADPARIEEWRAYLFFLRDHAAADGALPPQFDYLVHEVFGALVSS